MKVKSRPDDESLRPSVPASGKVATSTPAERILNILLEFPVGTGQHRAATFVCDRLGAAFPHLGIGMCLVDGEHFEGRVLRRNDDLWPGADPHDTTRLFPGAPEEKILSVGNDGSTLHLAGAPDALTESIVEWSRRAASRALELSEEGGHIDARERESLRAQIIQAEKLASLGQIAAGVVHELNNPLTSIIAYGDSLTRKALARRDAGENVDDDLERLQRISDAAQRILRFSRDLVSYARPSSDIPGPVKLTEVLDKALVFCEHEFERHEVDVLRDYEKDLSPVRGVSGQLVQVFVNLLTNGVHAASEGARRVSIVASNEDDFVLVSVQDEGCGMSDEQLDRIFEPFFTTKPVGKGTGLGLSIVRDIVSRHGGTLSVESRSGKGSTFHVRLPTIAIPTN